VCDTQLPEALHGVGGVGKSRTVIEDVRRLVVECDVISWIPSKRLSVIRSGFVDLAREINRYSLAKIERGRSEINGRRCVVGP
jgi:hypothetical protein